MNFPIEPEKTSVLAGAPFIFDFVKRGDNTPKKKKRRVLYDPEGFGEIPWEDFLQVLMNPEFVAEVDSNKREILLEKAQEKKTTAITFQDFVNVVKRFRRQQPAL
ncbi:hypothetical protein RUM44_011103 [Polyplax serrata]|uniref:EF-hand domain-containing protein n=1 Tax=Polyplax serrata TaxID=468196 RepID=A0ABR1AQL3_POLSC